MPHSSQIVQQLGQTGNVASLDALQQLVFAFEEILKRHNLPIQPGSELEAACCSILEVLAKNQNTSIRNPQEDVRNVFTEALGLWLFLKKIVRLQNNPCFPNFVPHLELLNKGTVGQNKLLRASQQATNKIFELLFALVLLDISDDVVLDHPTLSKGDNPDVIATIDGRRWGFACKTVYGTSGKTFYDNLEIGVRQIEAAPDVELGIVVVNFRNFIPHEKCWPLLNEGGYREGAEPIFAAYIRPEDIVPSRIWDAVAQKRDQVVAEIDLPNVMNLFRGRKALPAFLAFSQTCTGKASALGPIPTSIITLSVGTFGDVQAHQATFEKINEALHDRIQP
jgi:hypothetical protein